MHEDRGVGPMTDLEGVLGVFGVEVVHHDLLVVFLRFTECLEVG